MASTDSFAQEVVVGPSKDNTLYESNTGNVSNGAGSYLFVGSVGSGGGGAARRALVMFDVASAVPAGATIESVILEMTMSKTNSGATSIAIHRVLADWGEGASDAAANEGSGAPAADGDATWIHTFYNTETWQSPGGDFAPTASATASVSGAGPYSWQSTAAMIDDVKLWLENPEENFGWELIGDESKSFTSKRFDSRNHAQSQNRPRLRVTYSLSTANEENELPAAAELQSVWPNPFEREAHFTFNVDRPTHVRIDIYSVLGQPVATIADQDYSTGTYTATLSALDLPAGVYYARFASGGREAVRSFVRVD